MPNLIQIKCPFDGAVLSVMEQPGLQYKNVTCPICKHTYPFTQFKRVVIKKGFEDPETNYPGKGPNNSGESIGPEEKTRFAGEREGFKRHSESLILGRLFVRGTKQSFQLKPGKNIIGRRATSSNADFMIDAGEDRRISREHIVIDIKRVKGKGYVHYLSLCKEKINPTYIGNDVLYYGDKIILKQGDNIKLPGADIIFVMPDPEETLI